MVPGGDSILNDLLEAASQDVACQLKLPHHRYQRTGQIFQWRSANRIPGCARSLTRIDNRNRKADAASGASQAYQLEIAQKYPHKKAQH